MIEEQMRSFIFLAESLGAEGPDDEPVTEQPQVPTLNEAMISDLEDVCVRLRAFMESVESDEYALGVEMGMQRAADMIENTIRRYKQGDDQVG